MKICSTCYHIALLKYGLVDGFVATHSHDKCQNCDREGLCYEVDYQSPYWHGRMPFVPLHGSSSL